MEPLTLALSQGERERYGQYLARGLMGSFLSKIIMCSKCVGCRLSKNGIVQNHLFHRCTKNMSVQIPSCVQEGWKRSFQFKCVPKLEFRNEGGMI